MVAAIHKTVFPAQLIASKAGKAWDYVHSMPDRYGRPGVSATYLGPLDGLRALAIAFVIVWHVCVRVFRLTMTGPFDASDNAGFLKWVPHGEIGVSLFFFISGFIIVRPFMNGSQGLSMVDIGRFYLRRVLRIAPPHAVLVTLAFLVLAGVGYRPEHAVNFDAARQSLGASYAASLVFMNGLIFHSPPRLNPPTWSLEIEIQFYLVSPLIVVWFLAYQRWVRGGILSILPALVAAFCVVLIVTVFGAYSPLRWTLISYLHLFLLGVLVAYFETTGRLQGQARARRYDAVFLAGLGILMATGLFRDQVSFGAETVRIFGTMLAVGGMFYGAVRGRIMFAMLGSRWVTLLGAMSYSIYLTHVAVIQLTETALFQRFAFHHIVPDLLLALLVALPSVLVVGALYYIWVERYFLRTAGKAFPLRRQSLFH